MVNTVILSPITFVYFISFFFYLLMMVMGKSSLGRIATYITLGGFAVRPLVIADVQPGGEGTVEFFQREDVAGSDFRFELTLGGLEEPLNESAGRRVAWGTVAKSDLELITGSSESFGIEDLRVVQIELEGCPMGREGSDPRVDEDVEILARMLSN